MKSNFVVPFKSAATVDVATDGLVFYGGAVKAAGIENGYGILEGYGVVFDTPGAPESRDLSGQYFTKNTYLGPRDGDGADTFFHHTLEIPGVPELADHIFAPVKTQKDDIGLFSKVVLDMSNRYERAVYGLGAAGKLGFSSGTAAHLIRAADDGELKRWPIVEMSLTPTPCEPRARATAMKALQAQSTGEAMTAFVSAFKAIFDSQEEAEAAFMNVVDNLDYLHSENSKLRELEAIQREALLLHADILRLALPRY